MSKVNHQDLEDAYQHAELKLHKIKIKYPKNTIKNVNQFKNAVAHNYLVDLTRHRYRIRKRRLNHYKNIPDKYRNPLGLLIEDEELTKFNDAVSLLNLREQTIIRYLLAGVRVKDISALLNLTPDHISVIIQRAKVKIQKLINTGKEENVE